MKKLILVSPIVIAIAACSGGGSDAKMQPGEWEMKMELVDVKAEGLPPAMLDAMKQQMASQPAQKQCLTQEEVDNMSAEKLGGDNASGCQASNKQFGGGTIRADLTCSGQNGGPNGTINMSGTYGATEMNMDIKSDIQAPGMPSKINTNMRITGRRIGDCPAK